MPKPTIQKLIDILIVLLVLTGVFFSLFVHDNKALLTTSGLKNFKYYTVLSNVFAGIVSLISLIVSNEKKKNMITVLRLTAASMVTITFLTIALFLGPLYGMARMYRNANFFFHLVVPVITVINYLCIADNVAVKLKATFMSAALTFLYGFVYLMNCIINGIGEWPDTNDWYGFLNWGYPVGLLIFAVITLFSWLVAVFLRFLYNNSVRKPLPTYVG